MNRLKLFISKHSPEKEGRHQEFILNIHISFKTRKKIMDSITIQDCGYL